MSTYEHRGGTPAHNPDFDRGDVSELEDAVLGALEEAQKAADVLDEAMKELRNQLGRALSVMVKVGDIIDRTSFGRINVVSGNARGVARYEVASEARLQTISTHSPELTKFYIEAWPLNDAGKRLSGRAGNNSRGRTEATVTLGVALVDINFDETASGNDILMRFVARAAQRMQDSQDQVVWTTGVIDSEGQ